MDEIRDLHHSGLSQVAISAQTGHDRKTIRKYLRDPSPPRRSRSARTTKLTPYREHIDSRLAGGVWNAVVLLRELRGLGYTGGYTRVKDYLAPRRALARVMATRRFETAPGEQAQVDWGHVGDLTESDGGLRRLSGFTLLLSHSRAIFADFALDETLPTLLRLHESAFLALGGVPRTILYDNMKSVVSGYDSHGDPVWHPVFRDFARHWGFVPRVCRPRRPQTKGKVEAGIKYLKYNFVPGCRADSYEDARSDLRLWLDGVANARVHGTTRRVVADAWEAERPHLMPLQGCRRYPYSPSMERRVTRDACVVVDTRRYSVPWRLVGQTVQVRQVGDRLEVCHGEARVAQHMVASGRGAQVVDPAHHAGMPYGPSSQARQKPQVHLRVLPPAVETRALSSYQALLEGDRYADA